MEKYKDELYKKKMSDVRLYILGLLSGIVSVSLIWAARTFTILPESLGLVGLVSITDVFPGPIFGIFLYFYLVFSGGLRHTENSVLLFLKPVLFVTVSTMIYALVVSMVLLLSFASFSGFAGPAVLLASFFGAYLMLVLLSLFGVKIQNQGLFRISLISVFCGVTAIGMLMGGVDPYGLTITAFIVIIWQMSMFPLLAGQKTPAQVTEERPSYGDWMKDMESDGR